MFLTAHLWSLQRCILILAHGMRQNSVMVGAAAHAAGQPAGEQHEHPGSKHWVEALCGLPASHHGSASWGDRRSVPASRPSTALPQQSVTGVYTKSDYTVERTHTARKDEDCLIGLDFVTEGFHALLLHLRREVVTRPL